jgi:hypothetical protein
MTHRHHHYLNKTKKKKKRKKKEKEKKNHYKNGNPSFSRFMKAGCPNRA